MRKLKIIFYLVCISTSALYAQIDNSFYKNSINKASIIEYIKSDANTFYDVGSNLFTSPLHFDNNDLFLTGAILGITAVAIPLDESIRNISLDNHSKSLDRVTYISEKFGKAKYGAILSGILYAGGLISGDDYTRQTGQMLAEAVFYNGLITTGAKMMFSRGRPFINEGSSEIDLFEFESDFEETSLPSGHTSTAFTMATVLSKRINNLYASIALYSMASLTAFQRIYADRHWFSDTILGAALGTAIGLKVVKLHEENSKSQKSLNYSIYPQIKSSNYGIGLAVSF